MADAGGTAFLEGLLGGLGAAYPGGRLLPAVALTLVVNPDLVVNLVVGSFVSVTLPSPIIPFSGLLPAGLRRYCGGLIFSPTILLTGSGQAICGILALGVLLLEGEANVPAMPAAAMQSQAFLRPAGVEATSRKHGCLMGPQ